MVELSGAVGNTTSGIKVLLLKTVPPDKPIIGGNRIEYFNGIIGHLDDNSPFFTTLVPGRELSKISPNCLASRFPPVGLASFISQTNANTPTSRRSDTYGIQVV